jgi:hypothetical protein
VKSKNDKNNKNKNERKPYIYIKVFHLKDFGKEDRNKNFHNDRKIK